MAIQSSQSATKQKSISSFFGTQPANKSTVKVANIASSPIEQRKGRSTGAPPNIQNDGQDDEPPVSLLPNLKRFQSIDHIKDFEESSRKRAKHVHTSSSVQASLSPVPATTTLGSPVSSTITTIQSSRDTGRAERTSKYAFAADAVSNESRAAEPDEDAVAYQKQKELLHEKFVRKLGRPGGILDSRRREYAADEDMAEAEGDEGEEDDEAELESRGKKGVATKKGGAKLTPMEKQVLEIKRKHMDTLIVVEVGYKYRFFGEDARIAAKELQIFCIPGKMRYDEHPSEAHLSRFASASFPTHRLHVHVKRLVQAGHKVGVVRQLETAALKAVGDNRNTPFVRKLTNLYTKGTYIDDTESLGDDAVTTSATSSSSGHLLCLTETNAKGWGSDEKVRVGFVAVQPTTGDIIYDDFEDGFMRSELETRLLHISPCEFVIVGNLSKATEKLIMRLAASRTGAKSEEARVERVEKGKTMAAQSYSHISEFYAEKVKNDETLGGQAALLDKVHQLSELVTITLSSIIKHLTDYGLEHVFDLTKYFQPFSARSHMLLNANTLTSLEIYHNQTDQSVSGSLFWTLDKTQTRFGQRLLRKWVGRPLVDSSRLSERIDAVEELMATASATATEKLRRLLARIKGDLEKSLIRIYYKKCTRSELVTVLHTLQTIANEYASVKFADQSGFQSQLLSQAVCFLPGILDDVVALLDRINLGAAKNDDKYNFLREEAETEVITDHKMGIISIEYDLNEQKAIIAEKLRKKKVEYTTSAGIEYLIEVDNTQIKNVPASWAKISGTKKLSRFHTPEVVKLIRERDQHKEALASACDVAFMDLLAEIGEKYQAFRDCIQSLATLDCLLSLAQVSALPGYCKPEFYADESRIEIIGGRHPMVEQILVDAYVPNDVELSSKQTRALLVTGPNMGGKSSYVRSVALISIMAQIGCFVPAESARLGYLDAVFTRMGAFDNMMKGESTFMVELNETSDILKQATPRSLVILDELGRGTSTHDGVAIAQAVLEHMVRECKSLTLFITHYQALARMAEQWPRGELKNVHMRFSENDDGRGGTELTFLYEVGEGTAHRSYGLNVARLAGLPGSIIDVAATKSKELETEETTRRLEYLERLLPLAFEDSEANEDRFSELVEGIEQLE